MSALKEFSTLKLSSDLLAVIQELGYEYMTPIQEQTIPLLLQGKDLAGQSKTGSGKTAAFAIPILQGITGNQRHLQALILCPTRELCAQVAREIRRLARRHKGLQVLILAGGQFIAPQLSALEKGAHIAVGTPGRILDILGRNKLDLSKIKTFVLDEADRMLDMGFEEDMQHILAALPRRRQSVFFSATFPESIQNLSEQYQNNPVSVSIADVSDESPAIDQYFLQTAHEDRLANLEKLLERLKPERTIVFCNLKAVTREVADFLTNKGYSSESLSGDLEQFERDRVMAKFRNLTTKILVATDVAARGIDIERLDLVVNYDTPAKPDVYVHRIGRTGRAGNSGLAVSLLSPKERHKLDRISEYTKTKRMFCSLDQISEVKAENSATSPSSTEKSKLMYTICIHGGRKDKLRPTDILGALTGDSGGLASSEVGKIEIHDRLTYVAIEQSVAEKALAALSSGRIKGRTFKVSPVS